MSWLTRLKKLNVARGATDKTDETGTDGVLSVLSVVQRGKKKKHIDRLSIGFRLPDYPAGAWATVIGRSGDTRAEMVKDLLVRWPEAELQPYKDLIS